MAEVQISERWAYMHGCNEVIRLRAKLAAMTAQNESDTALLRAASKSEHEIRAALGPQDHSGAISDVVKALVAKCERLSKPVSDEEVHNHAVLTDMGWIINDADFDRIIAARLQEPKS